MRLGKAKPVQSSSVASTIQTDDRSMDEEHFVFGSEDEATCPEMKLPRKFHQI